MNKEVGAWLGIEAKKAYGWLMDASGATPVVELVYQQSVVAVGPCHYFSRQLGATGIGDGHHAFVLRYPIPFHPKSIRNSGFVTGNPVRICRAAILFT